MAENQNIEWKEVWKDEYLKWICGFANAKGGKLYIGKRDDGAVCGVKNFEKLLDELPNKITNHLGIVCDVNLLDEQGEKYIEIIVPPYDVPISYHGKYYYRAGSTKQELQGVSLNDFLLRKAGKTWDDVIEPSASFDEIDLNAVESFLKGAVRSKRMPFIEKENDLQQLFQNLRLIDGGKLKRAAILLFGKDPRKYFINAFIKIGRFGESDTDLINQEVIEMNVFEMADTVLEILDKKYFKKAISYEGIHRVETTEYPYDAIREVLLNAIVHRNYIGAPIQISIYEDKLMVWNLGLLPEVITIEDLKRKHASYPRNPLLAEVFFKGGLIEAWGIGTLKIINECKKAKLPEPLIEEMTGGICVTLFKNKTNDYILKQLELNERQLNAIKFIKEKGKITNKDYQEINNCSRNTATNDFNQLIEKGVIKASGQKGAGAFYELI
jgi:ATP-dependent DNA helicase RecG